MNNDLYGWLLQNLCDSLKKHFSYYKNKYQERIILYLTEITPNRVSCYLSAPLTVRIFLFFFVFDID